MQIENKYDVIIVGSGGAGLRAAIGAAMEGCKTLVISRGKTNRSGATLLAGANISADVACDGATLAKLGISNGLEDDTPEKWFDEVLKEGFFMNNQELLQMFTETAGDRVTELVEWGMKVRGMEGDREISVFGSDILDTLYAKAKECGVTFLQNTVFTELLKKEGKVCGVLCLDLYQGTLIPIFAKAVVLCTGGAHNLFAENSGSTDLCGEGQAAAWRAGAELIDMEMISFCPTVTRYPTMYKGNILPYIFITTGYGTLLNKYGQTFTQRYLSPKAERLALDSEWNKMLLSYAIQSEILAGKGAKDGGVYFSLPMNPKEIIDELYADLPPLKTGIYADIMKIFESGRSLTVQPSAHYFEGGIRINVKGETNIEGLYAAGECSGGLFGANRVSAATTEMLVEGAQAGKYAALYAKNHRMEELTENEVNGIAECLMVPFARKTGCRVSDLKQRLHVITAESIPVVRCEKKLKKAWSDMEQLEKDLQDVSFENKQTVYNKEWREYLELRNMIPVAKAIIKSAMIRKESRGVHIRSDYFYTDNTNYIGNVVLCGEELKETLVPVVSTRRIPEEGCWGYTDYIEHIIETLE